MTSRNQLSYHLTLLIYTVGQPISLGFNFSYSQDNCANPGIMYKYHFYRGHKLFPPMALPYDQGALSQKFYNKLFLMIH